MRRMLCLLAMVSAVALVWSPVAAQLPPGGLPENHYQVYNLGQPITVTGPVILNDQFGSWTPEPQFVQEKFANPLFEKNGELVMWNDLVHHVWYSFIPIPHTRGVKVEHQFGVFDLQLREAVYLINPADKFDRIAGGWPDFANHYLCYLAEGPALELPVVMFDQFGQWPNVAHDPFCFCNPAEKIDPSGQVHPIVDPDMHLTCYWIDPQFWGSSVIYDDQFGFWTNQINDTCLLCLPSLKLEVIPARDSTWGGIKSLYFD